jgi:hypothetical protein
MAGVNGRLTGSVPTRFWPCHGKCSVNVSVALVEHYVRRARNQVL